MKKGMYIVWVGWLGHSSGRGGWHLGGRAELENLLSLGEVGVAVGLGLGRERAVGGPEVDEGPHGLNVVGAEQVQLRRGEDEVGEAAVELLLEVEVVKGLEKVVPVQVGVDAEHLQENGAADADELAREAAAAPDPVLAVGPVGLGRQGSTRHGGRVRGEDSIVVQLARDPPLHQRHVLVRRQLNGLMAVVQPGVRVVAAAGCQY